MPKCSFCVHQQTNKMTQNNHSIPIKDNDILINSTKDEINVRSYVQWLTVFPRPIYSNDLFKHCTFQVLIFSSYNTEWLYS